MPAAAHQGFQYGRGVIDGVNGLLCENSPEAIAQKIHDGVHRYDLSRIGEKAHETLYRNWESIVDEVCGRYKEIVNAYKRIRA